MFALNANGGTGKTYTINLFLSKLRSDGKIALGTTMSDIAATLLNNGRTLHSICKVPLNIKENSICQITRRDATAKLFQDTNLLIIDEISMGHRYIYEATNRSLQDVRGKEGPFAGLSVVFFGDWKQILPVIPRGARTQIVQACLKRSIIWENIKCLDLTINMRLTTSTNYTNFVKYITALGNGKEKIYNELTSFKIKIPEQFIIN